MLYLGIDVHRKQLTINVRNEAGEPVERRQVSTEWQRVRAFFTAFAERAAGEGGFTAIVETCGFHGWVEALLVEHGCREVVIVQPTGRSKQKTDRRDAQALSEVLWINRQRLAASHPIRGLRRIQPPTDSIAADRQLTALRVRMKQLRTRTLNKLHRLLLKHNLEQHCPTKGLATKRARQWLAQLTLPELDRFETDLLLAQWRLWDEQLAVIEQQISGRQRANATAMLIATMPGAGAFGSLALASRMDRIERFPRPGSLANYWGLVPSVRNSGEVTDRLGSITKQGSRLARFVLAQMVLHVLRRDGAMRNWYQRIKRRRGSKIARVAVMRRLATILWHMVKHNEPYQLGGLPRRRLCLAGQA
jgi:transposase